MGSLGNPPVDDPAAARSATGGGLRWKTAVGLIGINTVCIGGGIAATYIDWVGTASLAFSIPLAALITFVFFFTDSADIRTAITGAFVVLYLGFVSASFNGGVADAAAEENSFFAEVFNSLDTLMIAIIGFYFGGKAVEAASGQIASGLATRELTPAPPAQPQAPTQP